MRRLNDKNRETYAAHASLESIQVTLKAEQAERLRVERRVAWLEDLLVLRSQQVAAGTWPEVPAAEGSVQEPRPALRLQNLIGDKAIPGEHFYRPDAPDSCVFCDGQSYVYNTRSVNRMTKHAHTGGLTLCPTPKQAAAPMPGSEAAQKPLCPGCRDALTGTTKKN